jgi:broad specificity phosphatase PhoE
MPFDRVTRAAFPQDQVTDLHLLRHGVVDTGGRRRAYGHTDAPLSAVGAAQAEALIRFAVEELPRPAGILSSDLGRCRAIAEPLGEALGVGVRYLPVLREQHMGEWEWQTWESLTLREEDRIRAYWTDYLDTAPTGGESFRDLAERVSGWWDDAMPELWGKRWIVVGHIGVIRALLCQWFDYPLDQALRFAPRPGSHSHVLLAATGAVMQVFGERPGGSSASVEAPASARPMPDRPPRLALSGSAGVGKSTLGRSLAEHYGVPYIPEGMRARLEAGLQLHDLDHAGLRGLVEELWAEQQEAEQDAIRSFGGFVSDRGAVDYTAFWLHYRFTDDEDASARFFAETLGWVPTYDRIVLCPWGVLPLHADGIRSSNPWLQRHFQAVVEGLLARELDPARLLKLPPLLAIEERMRWVTTALDDARSTQS